VSRRAWVAVGAVTGAGVLALSSLAVLGSAPTAAEADGWSGWTGRVDTAAVSDRAAMTPDDDVAVKLLARASRAASAVAYAGRAVTVDRTTTSSTELVHVPGRGTLAVVTGQPRSSARFAPDGRSGSFADAGRQLALLKVNYRVLRQADLDMRVAGRPAEAVVAVDADGALAARYWLDRATGLLLRKELVGSSGVVWSRAGFDTISFDRPDAAELPTTAASDWSPPLDAAGLKSARQAGCACPDELPGGLSLVDSRRAAAGTVASEPVVHQLFSDGLESVSLFSLQGSLSSADADGLRSRGFTRTELDGRYAWVRGGDWRSSAATVVWDCGDAVLTLVTDDAQQPLATAAAVLAALPPEPEEDDASLVGRIVRGWDRLTGAAA
jgi:sigma-E factor negative regulatory protein RseB